MLFKIDENLHPDAAELLRSAGHDAATVFEQGLRGHAVGDVAKVCREELRAIVPLDLDFSDIREFPPEEYAGIIVLRLLDQSRTAVLKVLREIIPLLSVEPLAGRLWIVSEDRVRIRNRSLNVPR